MYQRSGRAARWWFAMAQLKQSCVIESPPLGAQEPQITQVDIFISGSSLSNKFTLNSLDNKSDKQLVVRQELATLFRL